LGLAFVIHFLFFMKRTFFWFSISLYSTINAWAVATLLPSYIHISKIQYEG
jgi:hypothetical protein